MRLRHVMAALLPAGTASALAILPAAGITAAAVTPHSVAHRMTPAVQNPLAYKYAGKVSGNSTPVFSCQLPGSSINCYNPLELAKAYDIPANLTGAGQTIVIIDAFGNPTISQDLNVEDTTFGLPAANLNVIYPDGQPAFDTNNADEVNWSGEIALDVESAHAVAPAATIDLVVSKSDQDADILSALKYVVGHRLGSVLSQSYGEAEICQDPSITKADELLFAAAALQGMSVFASSGDDGAALPTCDGTSLLQGRQLPGLRPAGDRCRRDQPHRVTAGRHLSVRDRMERRVRLERRRLQHAVLAPAVPARLRPQREARRARHLLQRRRQQRPADRLVAGRPGQRRRHLHLRRHQRGLAAVGGDHRARRPGRAPPARLPQPRPLPALARHRRPATSSTT